MAATGPSSPDTTKETSSAAAAHPSSEAAKSAANDAASSSRPAEAAAAAAAPSAKTDGTCSTTSAPTTTAAAAATMPSYHATQSSKAYTLSKQLLANGSLDDALSALEMALQVHRQMVTKVMNKEDDSDEVEFHESLAPLYYLYGTTLLYSVEESDVMMANGAVQGAGDGGTDAPMDMEVADENEEEDGEEMMMKDNAPADDNDGDEEMMAPADPAEDLQIAWENLDLARNIVSRLVAPFYDLSPPADGAISTIALKSEENTTLKSNDNNDDSATATTREYTPEQQTNLLLDLAQIHTRLGDLQRANANVLPCIDDYELALRLRLDRLGRFHRKVADAHFSLAGVYAEAPQSLAEGEGRVDEFVSRLGGAAGGGGGDAREQLSEEDKAEFRRRSLDHYLACGVAFAGLVAKMCGEDPEEMTKVEEGNGTEDTAASAASSASAVTSSNHHSKTMTTLRKRIASLSPPPPTSSDGEEIDDLKEMLDEIQEAVDTAAESEEGLRSLGEMKANEMKKHEAKRNGEGVSEEEEGGGDDGGTTTIGFGVAAGTAVNAFGGSSAAVASAAAAPTMMVVKKKKKKKPQACEDSESKRAKSE